MRRPRSTRQPQYKMISEESLTRFREAYKKAYGEDIPIEEAREMASRLLFLYEFIYRPLPGEEGFMLPPEENDPPSSSPGI